VRGAVGDVWYQSDRSVPQAEYRATRTTGSEPHLETPGKLTRILIHLIPITVLIVLSSEDVDEGKIQINKGELLRAC